MSEPVLSSSPAPTPALDPARAAEGGAKGASPPPTVSASAQSRERANRAALVFIFITVLLDTMALSMVAPVLPRLVTSFVTDPTWLKFSRHAQAAFPAGAISTGAVIFGLFNTVFALMQFFFSPMIGALSDRFGRRPLILASNLGLGLNYFMMAWSPNIAILFAGRVLSGITGASYGTASAYIADTTKPEERAHAFGMLGAAFGVGFVLGPAIGGMLGDYSARLPFWVAGGFSLANALYGLLVLPESLPKPLRTGFSWRRANPVGALAFLTRHPELFALAGVSFLSNLAQVSIGNVVVLYALHRYHWTPKSVGITLTVTGIALVLVQVAVVGRFVGRFGNRVALMSGLCFGAMGFLIMAWAPNGGWVWCAIPVLALWGMAGAACQGLMTQRVTASEQGQLQGANASLTGISELIGPSVFTLTFAYFVRPGQPMAYSGAPFVLAATLLLIAAAWTLMATRRPAPPVLMDAP